MMVVIIHSSHDLRTLHLSSCQLSGSLSLRKSKVCYDLNFRVPLEDEVHGARLPAYVHAVLCAWGDISRRLNQGLFQRDQIRREDIEG